jgi:hypothetical protein
LISEYLAARKRPQISLPFFVGGADQLIASFTALLSGCTLASLSVSTPFPS